MDAWENVFVANNEPVMLHDSEPDLAGRIQIEMRVHASQNSGNERDERDAGLHCKWNTNVHYQFCVMIFCLNSFPFPD